MTALCPAETGHGQCDGPAHLTCVGCSKAHCLTHLHASSDGARCTNCFIPDQWADGGATAALAGVMAVARHAFQHSLSLRHRADAILATKGDTADDQGHHNRRRAMQYISEAGLLDQGVSVLLPSIGKIPMNDVAKSDVLQ